MSRVFAIAPYEGLKSLIMSVASEFPDMDICCEIGNLNEGKRLVAMAIEKKYDIILSRGGTVDYTQSVTPIPILDIGVSARDILDSITLSQSYSGKKVVVGFERITKSYASICKLLNHNIDIYTVHSEEELPQLMLEFLDAGINVVIGDVITSQVARQHGLNALLITSGEDSVRDAFRRIVEIDGIIGNAVRDKRLAEKVLSEIQPYICIQDAAGTLRYGRFPEGTDRKALFSALASSGDMQRNPQKNMVFFRSMAGVQSWEGSCIRFDNEDLYLWRLCAELPTAENFPGGVTVRNAEDIPMITQAMFPAVSENTKSMLKRLEMLGKTEKSVLLEGEHGLNKNRMAEFVYCSGKRLPLVTVECKEADVGLARFLNGLAASQDARLAIFWKRLDLLKPEVQAELKNESSMLDGYYHIATTERDVYEMANHEWFEASLLEAMKFVRIVIPPLRERPEDLDDIVSLMIGELNEKMGKQIIGINRSALEIIKKQEWFGNEAMLKEVLELSMMETDDLYIQKRTIEAILNSAQHKINNYNITKDMTLDMIEREIIMYVLRDENMNQVKAAQRLGISRTTLWRKIR